MTQVSVVIPLYNKALYIQRALQSVLEQRHQDFEVVVIDDGSTDNGAEVVSAFGDSRIRLIQQENAGVSSARNRGVRESSGELVAFLDADDEWMPDFLETIAALCEDFPQAGFYATGFRVSRKDCRPNDVTLICQEPMCLIDNYFKHVMKGLFFCASSVVVPRAVFNTVGYFVESVPRGEDQDMWARIALWFPVAYAAKALVYYHQEAEGRACATNALRPWYPVFVHTVRREVPASPIPHSVDSTVVAYCNYLLLDYATRLVRAGFHAEARQVLRQEHFRAPNERIEAVGILFASFGIPLRWCQWVTNRLRAS